MEKREEVYFLTGHEVLLSLVESGGKMPPKESVEIREGYWTVVDVNGIMEPADFEKTMQDYGIDFLDTTESASSNS